MPVIKASNPSDHSCSTAYRGIEYRLLPGTQHKAMLLHGFLSSAVTFATEALGIDFREN
ncbi:MAG: hypothetical protein OXF84_07030 [Bacteroidetes bacterium]|nr:hypothetical protein [Bacteroidota bacterium]